jgi:hypothetical protein
VLKYRIGELAASFLPAIYNLKKYTLIDSYLVDPDSAGVTTMTAMAARLRDNPPTQKGCST